MTRDEAVQQVQNTAIPLDSFTIEGLKVMATALGLTVSSRPKKADLIANIRAQVVAASTTPPVIVPAAPAQPAPATGGTVQIVNTPKQKSGIEKSADRLLHTLFKRG